MFRVSISREGFLSMSRIETVGFDSDRRPFWISELLRKLILLSKHDPLNVCIASNLVPNNPPDCCVHFLEKVLLSNQFCAAVTNDFSSIMAGILRRHDPTRYHQDLDYPPFPFLPRNPLYPHLLSSTSSPIPPSATPLPLVL